MPAGQLVHKLKPATSEKEPGPQMIQSVRLLGPSTEKYFPIAQLSHTSESLTAFEEENLPAGQAVQEVELRFRENVPTLQTVHREALSAPASEEYCPASQSLHTPELSAASAEENVPAGQPEHELEP